MTRRQINILPIFLKDRSNIFKRPIWSKIAKFFDRQYFRVYGIILLTRKHYYTIFIDSTPPIVTYTYSWTISGKTLNRKKALKQLDFGNGTSVFKSDCNSSPYKYEPVGACYYWYIRNFINWNKVRSQCAEAVKKGLIGLKRSIYVDILF